MRCQGTAYTGEAGLLPHREAVAVASLLLLILPLLFLHAYAQTETTTAYNVTITVPVVSVTVRPSWIVNYRFVNNTLLNIRVECVSYTQCQPLQLIVGYNGTIYYNASIACTPVNGSCARSIDVVVPTGVAWVYYHYGGVTSNETVYANRFYGNAIATSVLAMAAVGLLLSLAVRSDPKAALIGLIVGSVLVYALVVNGFAPGWVTVLAYIAVVAAVLLYIMGAR